MAAGGGSYLYLWADAVTGLDLAVRWRRQCVVAPWWGTWAAGTSRSRGATSQCACASSVSWPRNTRRSSAKSSIRYKSLGSSDTNTVLSSMRKTGLINAGWPGEYRHRRLPRFVRPALRARLRAINKYEAESIEEYHQGLICTADTQSAHSQRRPPTLALCTDGNRRGQRFHSRRPRALLQLKWLASTRKLPLLPNGM